MGEVATGFFHGGCMWFDSHIFVDVDLIFSITRLPKERVDLTPFFVGKEQDKSLVSQMKEKYNLTRDKRGFDKAYINDQGIIFASKFLLSNLIWNMKPNQCNVGTIIAT